MNDKTKRDQEQDDGQGMHIDVGHLSVTGHVVFAGRDGSVNVTTGGDVAQTATTTLTVGGVETTREEYDGMVSSLVDVQETLENEPLEPDEKEAAQANLNTIETELTSEKPPNPHILVQATKALYRASPIVAGQLISLFSNPLVGQIVEGAGEVAINMRDSLTRSRRAKPNRRASSNRRSSNRS